MTPDSGGWSGFTNTGFDDAPAPAAPVTPQSSAPAWAGFTNTGFGDAPPPAAPVTPQSNFQPHVLGKGDVDWGPAAPLTPTQQVVSDVPSMMASGAIGFGKTAVGMLQLLAANNKSTAAKQAPVKPLNGLPPLEQAPSATADQSLNLPPGEEDQIGGQMPAHLLAVQQALSNAQDNIQAQLSPATKLAQAAGWRPSDKNNVFQHPFIQTALAKGVEPATDMLLTVAPAGLMGSAAKLFIAGAMGAQGAGGVMSAVSDTVNTRTDAQLRQQVPAYNAMRQKGMGVQAAKAKLVNQLGDTQALWSGVFNAALGDVGAESFLGGKLATMSVLKRVGAGAAVAGGVNAAIGAGSDVAQQQALAPLTGKPVDWHEVAKQSIIAGLQGVGFGGVTAALMRHAPEELAPGTAEHINSPEGAAVNAATHADHATVPGAPEPEPEPEGEPIDYDQQHGEEEDEEGEAAQPARAAAPPAVDEAQAAAVRAATEPAQAEQPATVPAPPAVPTREEVKPASAGLTLGPKAYIMPHEEADERVPVVAPKDVEAATTILTSRAARLLRQVPGVSSAEEGIVNDIMSNLVAQAHTEMRYYDGSPAEIVKQFLGTHSLQERISAALSEARQRRDATVHAPEPEPEAFGPEAKDTSEQAPQTRVRAGDVYEPGNEGALLAKINPKEDNRTTYARAAAMVAKRGDEAHPVYQDILDLAAKGRGGDNRVHQRRLNRARAVEQNYLRAEAARHEGKRPPTEHELLQHETPPLEAESDQAFWARMERAYRLGEDRGTFMKRGSFLYRAKKALDDARDRAGDSERYTGRPALPSKALTMEMRGEEFIARHPDMAGNGEIKSLGHDSLPMLKREGPAEPLHVKSAAARADQSRVKRGAEAMTGRLRLQAGIQKNIPHDDIRDVEDFLHFLGPHLTKDTGLSIRANAEAGTHGQFDPRTRIVTIYKSALERGELTRTAIHELWHSVETALRLPDKIALRKEYAQQFSKYINKNPWLKAFSKGDNSQGMRGFKDSLTGHEVKDFLRAWGDNKKAMEAVRMRDNRIDLIHTQDNYKFVDWHEYFAETMSDKYFKAQDMMDARAKSIMGHLRNFVQTIKNRIARLFGGDTSGRIYEGFEQKQFTHRQEALDAYQAIQFQKIFGNKPKDIIQGVEPSAYDGMAKAIRDLFMDNNRAMNAIRAGLGKLANGQDLARAGEKLFDWTPNTRIATESTEAPSHTFQNALNHMGSYALHISDTFAPLQNRMALLLAKAKPDDAATFQYLMDHSTHYNYDPSRAPDPRSKATSAHGIQRKTQHRVGYDMMKTLPPELQSLFKDTRKAVHEARMEVAREAVRSTIIQAHIAKMREAIGGSSLIHGGTTLRLDHDMIKQQTDRYMNKQETDDDKSFFGKDTHRLLAKERSTPNEFENYFPARRYGKQAVQYRDLRPDEHVFHNEADMEHFAKTTDLYIKGSSRKDFDANGDEVDKDDPAAKPIVRSEHTVRTQNEGLEFFDTPRQAKARVEELRNHPTNKYWVPDAEHTRGRLQTAGNLSPAALSVLRHALGKATEEGKNKAAIEHALNEAVIQLLPPNSVRYGALRRRNVMGASTDTLRVLHDYFLGVANTMARLRYGHEAFNALEAMREHTETHAAGPDGLNHVRQELVHLAELRSQASPIDQRAGNAVLGTIRVAQQYAFVNYMSNAAFNMVQLAQPWMTGMPYLAAHYGRRATLAEMGKAIQRLGFGADIGKEGVMQMYGAVHNTLSKETRAPKDYVQLFQDMLARGAKTPEDKALAAEHVALIQRLAADNAIGHNGAGLQVRAMLESAEKNPAMRALRAAEEFTRAMPTAIEVANRMMLGIATHELEKARSGDLEKAYIAARTAIKETQADYAPPNAPLWMQGSKYPWASPFFTFKKYAQMIYSLLGHNLFESFAGEDKETRKVARNTLLNTLAMHVAVTGMHGLPIGVPLMLIGFASLALGAHEAFNYDEWLHKTGHELGMTAKEIDLFANGLTTELGFNAVGRMGLSSLVLDQVPDENNWGDWVKWLGNAVIGAPGQLMGSTFQAIQQARHGDFVGAAEKMMPAVIRNKIRAIDYYEHGIRDTESNTMVAHLPLNQVIAQAMGWEPDAVEEAYGAREAGTEAKHAYQQSRAATIDSFKRAFQSGNMAAAQQALTQFNSTVPAGSGISFSQAMRAIRSKDNEQIDGVGFTKKQQFLADPMKAYNLPN